MAVSSEYKEFVAELLEPVGHIRIRNMFGGAGVYSGELMFGLIVAENLFLKVDELNRADYEAEEKGPFVYQTGSGKSTAMSYHEVPERLFDEPDELIIWARKALDAAMRARAAKPLKASRKLPRKSR